MKLTLLPSAVCAGSSHLSFLSSILVNDTLALDAGSVGLYGTPQEQARVRHIFLSHSHLDHLASLPIFVENAYEARADCVTIHASSAVLDTLQRDVFNDRLWPDFVALSRGKSPFLKLFPFEAGQTVERDGVRVTAVAVDHVVPTVAYVLEDDHGAVGVVSDTGPTAAVWERLNATPNLKAVFLEATFPNHLGWLAEVSRHLTPALVAGELRKLARPVRVVVIHIKARYHAEVTAELAALGRPQLEIGRPGVAYEF